MDAEDRSEQSTVDVSEGEGQSDAGADEGGQPQQSSPYRRDQRAVIYPETYDEDGRSIDNLGRVQPSRYNWLRLIRAVPSLIVGENPAFKRRVPDDFFAFDVEEDGTEVAVIACPCGKEPRVPLARCVQCVCERFYLATAGKVLVANSPLTKPPTTVVD